MVSVKNLFFLIDLQWASGYIKIGITSAPFFSLVFKSLYYILFIFSETKNLFFCRIWKWRAPVYLRVLWHFVHVPWRLPTTAICPVIHYTYSVILTVVTRGLLHINTIHVKASVALIWRFASHGVPETLITRLLLLCIPNV